MSDNAKAQGLMSGEGLELARTFADDKAQWWARQLGEKKVTQEELPAAIDWIYRLLAHITAQDARIAELDRAANIGLYWMASFQCESQEEGDLLTKQEEVVSAALSPKHPRLTQGGQREQERGEGVER